MTEPAPLEGIRPYTTGGAAYGSTMKAASQQGSVDETRQRIRAIVAGEGVGSGFVKNVLGRELGLA